MRGPGMRLDLEVRRIWRCPVCQTERKVEGRITSLRCSCEREAPLMKLIEPQRWRPPESKPLDPYVEFDAEELEAESAPETETTAVVEESVPETIEQPAETDGEPAADSQPEQPAKEESSPLEQVSTQQYDPAKSSRKKKRGRSRDHRKGQHQAQGNQQPKDSSEPKEPRPEGTSPHG